MNMVPYLVGWGALTLVVGILAIYRRSLAAHEDDTVHLNANADIEVAHQQALNQKIKAVERWGISLTVVVALWGLALAAYYLVQVWQASYKPPE